MGEKSENGRAPEDLLSGLQVTDTQEAECASPSVSNPSDPQPQSKPPQAVEAQPQEDQGEEEHFHDCSASFEEEEPGVDTVEDKPEDDVNSSELDEEYLIELEKNMPDEEKQVFIYLLCMSLPRKVLFKMIKWGWLSYTTSCVVKNNLLICVFIALVVM